MHTLTLVTGDTVTVSGTGGHVSARPGPGRTGITFAVSTGAGHVRVVPSDAGPLLAAGRLDSRLFDVTGLVAAGYDRRDALPLILTGSPGKRAGAVTGMAKEADLPALNGVAVHQSRATATQAWNALTADSGKTRTLRPNVAKVWLDATLRPTLDVSVPQIGAPDAWAAGYTGTGVLTAVLDTGIDDTHPDLAGAVVARQNFTEGEEPDNDLVGHGTHVADTIAGTGAASGGRYKGVAPGTKLLDGKVCSLGGCLESWIVAGMTWAAADQHAKVVNMSLGGDDDPTVIDPVEQAVQTLSDSYGTLFVIAAGNTDGGVVRGRIDSPGTAPAALTVGAVDRTGAMAGFSLRGPTGDGRLKPDLTAPGVNITAARGADATEVPGNPGDRYTTLSGTSMATPHVAGAAAILAQVHPDWSGQQIKAALMASAKPGAGAGAYDQGAGQVDVARAITETVTASPTGIGFATQQWPHQDDPVQTSDVTYHNSGSTSVTLALALDTTNPDGTPTPAGLFTVTPSTLLVPAGGDAKATVTADTRVSGPDGYLGGWLTATAGAAVTRTPMAVTKEVESYNVTLTSLDRNGAAPYTTYEALSKRDSDADQFVNFGGNGDNTTTVRVPKGHYTVSASITTLTGTTTGTSGKPVHTFNSTLLAQPDLVVDRPLQVTLDARAGKPVSVTVPRASATPVAVAVTAETLRVKYPAAFTVIADNFANLYTAQLGPDTTDSRFASIVSGQWAQQNSDGTFDDSPYLYSVMYPVTGKMTTGYQHKVAGSELAQVHSEYARQMTGETASVSDSPGWTSAFDEAGASTYLTVHLPFQRTEYSNALPDIGHITQFVEYPPGAEDDTWVMSGNQAYYQPGQEYQERFNRGVFAPAFSTNNEWTGITRTGNYLWLDMPMYGDGQGRPGNGYTGAFTATLFQGDTQIGATRWSLTDYPALNLRIPDQDATYRLELYDERPLPNVLSTKTDIAWTFRSSAGDPDTTTTLPLWTVRFNPALDRYNRAPEGGVFPVPVTATAQTGATVGTLTRLDVFASDDDGATWNPVRVTNGVALVPQPSGSGYVSLRASTLDSQGNATTVTIVHAYAYGQPK